MTPRSEDEAGVDDDDGDHEIREEDAWCERCNGRGYVIVCWDDLCANSDRCIHGDGERVCPECGGRFL